MFSTVSELEEFFSALNEESRQNWIVHYNELLNSHFLENWERESLEDLIKFNKSFDI